VSEKNIIAIYIRLPKEEVERLIANPGILPLYDPRVALNDGRGLDLGRAWEELGCFLDGGVRVPSVGPTVGEIPMPESDSRATWSYVEPDRVVQIAPALDAIESNEFSQRYQIDLEETADSIPFSRTGGWGNSATYLYNKLRALAEHYATASEYGEAMLVRIGERV